MNKTWKKKAQKEMPEFIFFYRIQLQQTAISLLTYPSLFFYFTLSELIFLHFVFLLPHPFFSQTAAITCFYSFLLTARALN